MVSDTKNQMFHKSAPVSSNDPINTNHIQISQTGTDHFNSKVSKNIQFEKKRSLSFLIFDKVCKRIIKKTKYLVYSGPLTVNFR